MATYLASCCVLFTIVTITQAQAEQYNIIGSFDAQADLINSENNSDRKSIVLGGIKFVLITDRASFIRDATYFGGANKVGKGGDGILVPFGQRVCKNGVNYKPGARALNGVDISNTRKSKCFQIRKNTNGFSVNETEITRYNNNPIVLTQTTSYNIIINGTSCNMSLSNLNMTVSGSSYKVNDIRITSAPSCNVNRE